MQHYKHHNRKQCLICPRHEKTNPCGNCGCSHYCSKECQVMDLPVHRTICRSFAQFRTRSSSAVRRAIYFPPDSPNPEFVWMEMDQQYGYDQPDLVSMRKTYLEVSDKNYVWPVQVNTDYVRMTKIYPHIILGCSSKASSLDQPVNRSISTLIGKEVHCMRGALIAYGQIKVKNEDGERCPVVTDLDTTDLTVIANYFLGRYDVSTVQGVRIYSNRNSRPGHRFNANTIHSDKGICNGDLGVSSPISVFFGMPLAVMYQVPLKENHFDTPEIREHIEDIRAQLPPDSGNRLAALLMIDMGDRKDSIAQDFGTIFSEYLTKPVGDALIIRKDQKPLDQAYLEAFCTWIAEDLLPKFTDANDQINYALATELDEEDPTAWKRGVDLIKLRQRMWDRCSRTRFNAWCKEKGINLGRLGQL